MLATSLNHTQNDTGNSMSSMLAIASVGIATLTMLETLLPTAAQEVESGSQQLTNHFSVLLAHIRSEGHVPEKVNDAISGIIVGMQFQDRNTQIMDNAATILERYRTMLEDICGNLETLRRDRAISGKDIAEAVEHILSSIRLTEIRTRYLEALRKAKMHHDSGPGDQSETILVNTELF